MWLLALVSFLVAWNRGMDLLYGLVALILAVQVLSWLLPWLAVRGVSVERKQSGRAQAGKTIKLHYRVHSKKPSYHIVLTETLPCSAS